MAIDLNDASTEYLYNTSFTAISDVPCTLGCWVWVDQTNDRCYVFSINDYSANNTGIGNSAWNDGDNYSAQASNNSWGEAVHVDYDIDVSNLNDFTLQSVDT